MIAMDILVGFILLVGVLVCAAFLMAGILWQWIATGSPGLHYTLAGTNLFHFWLADLRQLAAGELRPTLLINLGIALLMMTPYVRVLASTVYFAFAERNVKYTLFTGFVLAVLTYSLLLR